MEVSEQINSVINNLSEKLQVPVDYVLQTLIKQASVQGIVSGIIVGVSIIVILSFIIWSVYYIKKDTGKFMDDGIYFAIWAVPGMCCVFPIFAIVFNLGTLITCLFNPEYWALQQIFNMIQ